MVELPRGEISENRRGGVGVLELLLVDMQKRQESGYIRCEAGALGGSVGQITVRDGTPSMAIYEDSAGSILTGHAAVGAIQEASALEGSSLSRHMDVDLELIESLHPLALLHLEDGTAIPWSDDSDSELWWQQRQKRKRQWKRLDSWMPEQVVEDTERGSLPPLPFNPGAEFMPGMVALVDTPQPLESMQVVAHLGRIGHPLLVISRTPSNRLEDEVGLPSTVTMWLTEKGESENVCNATLEEVRRQIDTFLFGSKRACILLDGTEYLFGLHGFDRTLELLRFLVDMITSDDHLLLLPVDLDVLTGRQRSILLREVDLIDATKISDWAQQPAQIEGHQFCSDDWVPLDIPEPVKVEAVPSTEPIENGDANRWSISGVVDAWKKERHDEVEDVIEAVSAIEETAESLPDWAINPSANRDSEVVVKPEPELSLPVEKESEVPSEENVNMVTTEPMPEEPKYSGPRPPTVNHRGKTARKVRRKRLSKNGLVHLSPVDVGDILSEDTGKLKRQEMSIAASRAKDVEAKVEYPSDPITQRDKLDFAATRARQVQPGVNYDTGPDMRVMSMTAAKRSAGGVDISDSPPPLSVNEAVREASSRSQRNQHLTGRIAEMERSAIRSLSQTFTGSSGADVTIWERIRKLEDAGIDTQLIVEKFAVDPEGALKELKEAEG